MSEQDTTSAGEPIDHLLWIDKLCNRFEAELRNCRQRSIKDFLLSEGIDPDAAGSDLMRELACLESDYALAADDPGQTGLPSVSAIRYELGEEIARGGMGIVYRARDLLLDREVGLKTLLQVPVKGNIIAKRFRDEARITGQLQHPNIPPVHDLGTLPDGRPFLAMKLVKGRTLDASLKARIDPAHEAGRYLAIFEQIAQGVAYAHAHRVIHRDLKPLNVMVGAFGEVQVMDWGLAKVLADTNEKTLPISGTETFALTEIRSVRDASEATRAGSVFGSPAYMPREQAIGAIDQIDTRSDVFSLGGILCAILTGWPPYVGADAESLRQLAAIAKLDAAFARLDACGTESEWIALCKRCLSPERNDRPDDAGAVAKAVADLRSEAEQRARRAELNRVKAEGERATAEARAEEEAKTRRVAEEKAIEQRKKQRSQLSLMVAVALLLLGSGAFAWWREYQANERKFENDRSEGERLRIEAQALADQARLEGERDAEKRIKREQALEGINTSLLLAADLRKQYKFKLAAAALTQAADLGKGGVPERLPEVEQSQRDLAFVVKLDDIRFRKWVWLMEVGGKGHFNENSAPPEYHKAFAERGLDLKILDPVEAAKRIAGSAVKAELVAAMDDWGLYESDKSLLNRLLEIARRADPNSWTDPLRDLTFCNDKTNLEKLAANADLVSASPAALVMLADLMWRRGSNPIRLLNAARAKHPDNFELAFYLGLYHIDFSKDGQQIGPFEAARALRPESYPTWLNLGFALFDRDVDGAIAALRQAIALEPTYAQAHCNLGSVLFEKKNDVEGAIVCFRKAIELDSKNALAYCNLGAALSKKNARDQAITAYKQAIVLNPKFADAHFNLGLALAKQGAFAQAVTAFKTAIELDRTNDKFHFNLGLALRFLGDLDGAISSYQQAISINPKYAQAFSGLGIVLYTKGDLEGAIEAYKQAIELDPTLGRALHNLAMALHERGDLNRAIAVYKQAIKLDQKDAENHNGVGLAYYHMGDLDAAHNSYKEALKIAPKNVQAREQIQLIQRMISLRSRLPDVSAGKNKPQSPDEECSFAYLSARPLQRQYFLAVRLYKEAFSREPKLADTNGFDAACAAVLAAAGEDVELKSFGVDEWGYLTNLAHIWLQADLADLRKDAKDPKNRPPIHRWLVRWKSDLALEAVRGKKGLAAMTSTDRRGWENFWADVDALMTTICPPVTPAPRAKVNP